MEKYKACFSGFTSGNGTNAYSLRYLTNRFKLMLQNYEICIIMGLYTKSVLFVFVFVLDMIQYVIQANK